MKVTDTLQLAKDSNIITPEEHTKLLTQSPKDATKFLSDKISGDTLSDVAPRNRVVTTAIDDGKAFLDAAKDSQMRVGSTLKEDSVIKGAVGAAAPNVGAKLFSSLTSDTIEKLENNGEGHLARIAVDAVENHIFREAAASVEGGKPEAYLNQLRSGYDQLRKNGLFETAEGANPDAVTEASRLKDNYDAVNKLLDIKKTVEGLKKKFPDQDLGQKFLSQFTSSPKLASTALSILSGIVGLGTVGGVPGAVLGVTGKWMLSKIPVIDMLSKISHGLERTIRPEGEPTAPAAKKPMVPVPTAPAAGEEIGRAHV